MVLSFDQQSIGTKRSELGRMVDGKRQDARLPEGFTRRLLAYDLNRLQDRRRDRNDVVAAAQAVIAAGIVAARRVRRADVGNVAGIRLRARDQKQDDGGDAQNQSPRHGELSL
jgi:hypothetical protein